MAKAPKNRASKVEASHVDTQSTGTEREDGKELDNATQLPMTKDGEPGVDHAVPGADPSKVERKTVRTSGKFSLKDPYSGLDIPKETDVEVVVTTFIRNRLETGDLVEA